MTPPSTRLVRQISAFCAVVATFAASTRSASSAEPEPLVAWVGTFSSPLQNVKSTQVDRPPGNGRGIHIFHVDPATGAMTPAGVHEMGNSPSFLALGSGGTRLYSANETQFDGPEETGTVTAFATDSAGALTELNSVSSGGKGPTYLSLHPSGKWLFVANYFGGSVAVLPVLPDGRLGPATDVRKDQGEVGPRTARSAPPGSFAFSGHDQTHAHMVAPDPAGKFVLHVDLGLDRIHVWRFDSDKGTLAPNDPPFVSLPPGDGPRHLAFHPSGNWLYSIQEEGSTVALFDWDAAAGRLAPRQTVSSLPPGYAGSNFCSEILVSRDGRHLYAGNRLHDSIAIFAIGDDGTLRFTADEWTRGNYPRSFDFAPGGEFLHCCNQRADHVSVFRVDRQSGALTFAGHFQPVGNPSMILFRAPRQ